MSVPEGMERVSGPHDNARPHSARTKARKAALDVLFEADLRDIPVGDAFAELRAASPEPPRLLTIDIVQNVADHADEIDRAIAGALTSGWTIDRMPRVDRCLVRIATCELRYTDSPSDAIISEAVGLAGEYSTEDSAAFVNGVLRAIAKQVDATRN